LAGEKLGICLSGETSVLENEFEWKEFYLSLYRSLWRWEWEECLHEIIGQEAGHVGAELS